MEITTFTVGSGRNGDSKESFVPFWPRFVENDNDLNPGNQHKNI